MTTETNLTPKEQAESCAKELATLLEKYNCTIKVEYNIIISNVPNKMDEEVKEGETIVEATELSSETTGTDEVLTENISATEEVLLDNETTTS